jgi:hypothetical protein
MTFKRIAIALGILVVLTFLAFLAMVRFGGLVIHEKKTRKVIMGYDNNSGSLLINEYQKLHLTGVDGPYLVLLNDSVAECTQVTNYTGQLEIEFSTGGFASFQCLVDNEDGNRFTFFVQNETEVPLGYYDAPEKIIALSDIEGNFNALYSLLISNGVMDSSYRWTFGTNHLVIGGDVMDRGKNVTQAVWLLYHLEKRARHHGGRVHFILGNHELMNLEGDISYVDEKYLALAQQTSSQQDLVLAYKELMSNNTVMTDWMKQKNCIVKIGRTLFLHGGISPELMVKKLSIDTINSILRKKMNGDPHDAELAELITTNNGPLWYRGMAIDHKDHAKADESYIDAVLKFYDADRIVIGHSIVDSVSTDYNGKVVRTDVVHGEEKYSSNSQALLIEGTKLFRVNARGEKRSL